MSTLLHKAARLSAKRKLDEANNLRADDLKALGKFLNETWDKHKGAFFEGAATNEKKEFQFEFKLPEGLVFTEDDIKEVLQAQVDDFKGIATGLYVFAKDGGLLDANPHGDSFKVQIDWRYEHDEALRKLKKQRRLELRSKLEEAKEEEEEEEGWEPEEEADEEVEEKEEKGCWNVVVPARDGKPERLIPVNLAVVGKGSESVTHLSFK